MAFANDGGNWSETSPLFGAPARRRATRDAIGFVQFFDEAKTDLPPLPLRNRGRINTLKEMHECPIDPAEDMRSRKIVDSKGDTLG